MSVHPDQAGPFYYVLQDPVRILFVDDDPILREFATVNLATEQAMIETAPDGVAALAAIEAHAPDLVLLDLEMPHLEWLRGAGQALRADERRPATARDRGDRPRGTSRPWKQSRLPVPAATSFVVKLLNWRLLSHQIRYVHRAARAERQLTQGRDEAATQLQRLAAESTRFIAQALAHDPALRPVAVTFAKAADAVLQPRDTAAAA